jgi:hypothetical protein
LQFHADFDFLTSEWHLFRKKRKYETHEWVNTGCCKGFDGVDCMQRRIASNENTEDTQRAIVRWRRPGVIVRVAQPNARLLAALPFFRKTRRRKE